MHPSPAILASAANHLQKVLEAETRLPADLEALHDKLWRVVLHLLRTDLSRLLHILYRVDVEERLVKEAMAAGNTGAIAGRISRLILERELEKARIRFKYRQG